MNPARNLSFWEQDAFFKSIDVAIIGSGIVGLSAAITLKEKYPSWHIVIFERGNLPSGASTRNAGFACFGSPSELLDDLTHHDEETVFNIVKMRWEGLQKLRQRLGDKAIGYQHFGGYELFKTEDNVLYESCVNNLNRINTLLKPIFGQDNFYDAQSKLTTFQFPKDLKLLGITVEGQIHTGNMMKALLKYAQNKGVKIYNGFDIQQIEDTLQQVHIHTTNHWELKARKVIIATNGFTKRILPNLAVQPARNQVLITKPISNLPFKGTFHLDKGYYYFRNVGQRVLFGGGRNIAFEAEQINQFGLTQLIQDNLIHHLKTVILPNHHFEIEQWWSGILGVGNQKSPIIQQHSDNVVLAVRLSGIGVAIGSIVGEKGANLLLE